MAPSPRAAATRHAAVRRRGAGAPRSGHNDFGGGDASVLGKEAPPLDKTRLCRFFLRGRCERGDSCSFAHGRGQLRPRPDLFKTQLCREFATSGTCVYGSECRFAHTADELRDEESCCRNDAPLEAGDEAFAGVPLPKPQGLDKASGGGGAQRAGTELTALRVSRQSTMDSEASPHVALSDWSDEPGVFGQPGLSDEAQGSRWHVDRRIAAHGIVAVVKNTFLEFLPEAPSCSAASRRSSSSPPWSGH